MEWHFVAGGAVVGLIVGATGVGGGSLMTPLLTLAFGISPQVAVGTDLLFAAITKAGGAAAHARQGNVSWPLVGWLAAGSVPAALVTLALLRSLSPDVRLLSAFLTTALGIALLATAAALALRPQIQALGARLARRDTRRMVLAAAGRAGYLRVDVESEPAPDAPRPAATLLVGAVIGSMVTLTSVGAGVLGVVALFFLYPWLAPRRIVGVDIAHAVPLTLVAGLGHASMGTVDWSLLGSLLVGSLPAIMVGAHLSRRLPEAWLRSALTVLLTLIGLKLVV